MGKILKRTAALVTGAAMAVSVAATAELPASAASSCNASFSKYSTIHQGSKGTQAKAAECLLRQAGFPATVNGSFSAHDARQMSKFRTSVGMTAANGYAGPRGWSALLAQGSTPTLRSGSKGASVLRLQRSLRALGWTKVTLNGTYGSSTVSAVKAAQKVRGQQQTGTATKALWQSLQRGRVATASEAAKVAAKKKKTSSSSKGAKALAFAKKQLGDRYRYGATGPNAWDCSGLTGGSWKAAGVRIPRTSQAQFKAGKKVAKSDLKPGDLVFFYPGITHVAIYAGGGKVIHASRPGKPVQYIKMSYMPYKGARRPG